LVRAFEDIPPELDWLSAEEQRYLGRLRVEKRRADWLLGRWTAKSALRGHPWLADVAVEPTDLTIRPAADGAPEALLRGRPVPFGLSLSHRAGRGLCALAQEGVRVGCDLEVVEQRSPGFLRDYFTLEEQELLRSVPAAAQDRCVTLFWAAKESTLKALRVGLRADTRRVQVDMAGECLATARWSRLGVADADSELEFSAWTLMLGELTAVLVTSPPSLEPVELRHGPRSAGRGGKGGDL